MNDSITVQFELPRETAVRLGARAASAGESLAQHIIGILGSASLETPPCEATVPPTASTSPRKRKLIQWEGGGILGDLSRREIYDDAR